MVLSFITNVYSSFTRAFKKLYFQQPYESSKSKFYPFYYTPLVVLLLALVLRAINKPVGDFGNYYYASKFLLNSQFGDWVYDPSVFNLKIYELGQRDFFLNYNPPPIVAIFYLPFTLFNVVWAKTIWNLLNCFILIFCLYRVQKTFFVRPFFI